MKKSLLLTYALVLTMFLLSACSQESKDEPKKAPVQNTAPEITSPSISTNCTVSKSGSISTLQCPDGSMVDILDGSPGEVGKDGSPGASGPQGPQGQKGDAGLVGANGKDGSSCSVKRNSNQEVVVSCTDGTSEILKYADNDVSSSDNVFSWNGFSWLYSYFSHPYFMKLDSGKTILKLEAYRIRISGTTEWKSDSINIEATLSVPRSITVKLGQSGPAGQNAFIKFGRDNKDLVCRYSTQSQNSVSYDLADCKKQFSSGDGLSLNSYATGTMDQVYSERPVSGVRMRLDGGNSLSDSELSVTANFEMK